MPERFVDRQMMSFSSPSHSPHVQTGIESAEETRRIDTVVVALVPEYHQVKVRDRDAHLYALTRKTHGVDLATLREGQRVVCTVTRALPRVLTAAAVA